MIGIYCTDAIILRGVTARDEWNEPTTVDTPCMARVEWQAQLVRNVKGEQVVATGKVYLPLSVTPTHETRIVIDGIEYGVLTIAKRGSFSPSHWEVYFRTGVQDNG